MTIRIRLLIILLVTALTPLVITALTHQISIRIAKHHLITSMRKNLDDNARLALQELHQSHVALLQRDTRLMEALLAGQGREIQQALSSSSLAAKAAITGSTFGYDPTITITRDAYHPLFQDTNDPNIADLHIDYQRQHYSVAPYADPNQVSLVLNSMAPLTGFFHSLCQQAPKGVLWMTTSLQRNAITLRYPAGESTRVEPDGGRRNRRSNIPPEGRLPAAGSFPQARLEPSTNANGLPRSAEPNRPPNRERPRFSRETERPPIPIIPDRTTNQWVMLSSTDVASADGRIRGRTTVARTIPEVFKDMALPERWGHETEHMLILVDPNAPNHISAEKLLHDKQAQIERTRWRGSRRPGRPGGPQPEYLTSRDTPAFEAMMTDLLAGQAGTQLMEYNGQACLWAYQPLNITHVGALLIVPYDRVTELAVTMEQSLIKESLLWLQMTTVVLILATALAIILAVAKARSLTDPITSLIHAGRQLATGNYEARVRVTADDELGQLGRVFNDIGPKLKDRDSMKHSLQLAGAIQKSLLPKRLPNLTHFDVAGQCLYCEETGGDYYDFIDLSDVHDNKLSVVLADVSGHGIGAALLMASVRGIMHSEIKHSACDLVKLLDSLNEQVIEDTDDDKFVTLFHGILDDRNRSFIWSSAGHEPAYWYHKAQLSLEELPNTGMPIGIMPDTVYDQAGPITPDKGDLIIIGTDGIWEARNEHHAFFGKERFFQTIKKHAEDTAKQICSAVIDEVTTFIGPGNRTDDVTLIVIKAV
ncbi:MAG: SpoIIE family protein phosphatase [Phycisphaerae bacterium]|nr:SpoIIE family protein phosphatase [Phycisphaerae bacterium]